MVVTVIAGHFGGNTLKLLHTPGKPYLKVHYPTGIGKIPWQTHIGALNNAGPLSQVTLLKRHVFGARFFLPELFALHLPEFCRITVLQKLAIPVNALFCL
nr:hypothetical protein NCPCFENI_01333 [Cupriavidus sp.]